MRERLQFWDIKMKNVSIDRVPKKFNTSSCLFGVARECFSPFSLSPSLLVLVLLLLEGCFVNSTFALDPSVSHSILNFFACVHEHYTLACTYDLDSSACNGRKDKDILTSKFRINLESLYKITFVMACFWLLLQELHAKQLLTFALWAVLLYKLFEV